jgi:hypothetical protein
MKGDSNKIKKNKGRPGYDEKDLAEKLIHQLKNNHNNITTACKTLGISRSTYNNFYNKSEWFRQQIDDLSEDMVDFVEGKMFQIIDEMEKGAPGLIMFYLKNKGKKRGYGDDGSEDGDAPTQINIKFD